MVISPLNFRAAGAQLYACHELFLKSINQLMQNDIDLFSYKRE
jgi:hypothetical protein